MMSKSLSSSSSEPLNTEWASHSFSSLLLEQISVMLMKENSSYGCVDYLRRREHVYSEVDAGVAVDMIDEHWRQKAAEWMFKVLDFYDLDRDIVNIGMTFLDRTFTETMLHRKWDKLQCRLVAITSLKLAIKLNEARTMTTDDMLKLGMGKETSFTATDLNEMESQILSKLSWNVFPPTAFCFVHHMIYLFPPKVTNSTKYIVQEIAKYTTELSICVYAFIRYKASARAYASILVAVESIEDDHAISTEHMAVFHERVFLVSGLKKTEPDMANTVKEIRKLLSHNANVKELVAIIRSSNSSDHDNASPKSSAVKHFDEA